MDVIVNGETHPFEPFWDADRGRHGPMGEVEAVFPFSDIRTS